MFQLNTYCKPTEVQCNGKDEKIYEIMSKFNTTGERLYNIRIGIMLGN